MLDATMKTITLKNCPHCGYPVTLKPSETGRMYAIVCEEGSPCLGTGFGSFILTEQFDSGLDMWNTRVDERTNNV